MIKWRKTIMLLMLMTTSISSFGQEVEMADTMRSNGKIYVVVAVVLTILIGLILYVMRLERKIKKLEKDK